MENIQPLCPPNSIIKFLDAIAEATGRYTAWLTLAMVIFTCIVVGLRHMFGIGLIALQESVTYMHAAVFMLGAAFTLKRGGHVRVDIFYRRYRPCTRAWIDALGSIVFTLPLMLFIGIGSWDFVVSSWKIQEGSQDSGGIGGVYLLKSLLPLMALSVCLQAIAELLRNILILTNVNTKYASTGSAGDAQC